MHVASSFPSKQLDLDLFAKCTCLHEVAIDMELLRYHTLYAFRIHMGDSGIVISQHLPGSEMLISQHLSGSRHLYQTIFVQPSP